MFDEQIMLPEMERCIALVESRLGGFFTGKKSYSVLYDSMRYSLIGGGKRIRAVICLKFCEASCGDMSRALDAACAIEMMHAYSLIHDDLPCMDDDDMRRGKPSNHIKFGEYTATLAGDALQAAAFETLANSDLPPGNVAKMIGILAYAAGPDGICGGQYLDITGDGKRLAYGELDEILNMKTVTLISASARLGVVAANGSAEQEHAAEQYARAVGKAFQVCDDILDCTASQEDLGKPIGSDSKNDKTTFASLLGIEECGRIVRMETDKAVAALGGHFADTGFLVWLARMLAERKS